MSATAFAVHLKTLYQQAGEPTYALLIRQGEQQKPPVRLTNSSIGDWLTGTSTPNEGLPVRFLLEYLRAKAEQKGHRVPPLQWWLDLRKRAWKETHPDRGGRPSAKSGSEPTQEPLGPMISEVTDPFALEVHPAIEPLQSVMEMNLPTLPAYIEREHDVQLRGVVEQAAAGQSRVAVLVGGSSTGKTRACWEAVQALPDEWRLWHPLEPDRPDAVVDALGSIGPCTVVWLNETQHYLLTPGSKLGDRVAAGFRELLRSPDRGPVLVLGAVWPEYWATLTTPPTPGQNDPHAQARALLRGTGIPVADSFEGTALDELRVKALSDPRLAEALARGEGGRITQYLAGAPALLERYQNAPAAAKALIEAAMDARRLGHSLALSRVLLAEAASGYLTDTEWDNLGEEWLDEALTYTSSPCHGIRGPITRIRPRPRHPTPTEPHYRLADYLEEHGRAARRTARVPVELWDALTVHAAVRDTPQIAHEAERRGLYRYAYQLAARATAVGNPEAMLITADLLDRVGRIEEAVAFYKRVVERSSDKDLSIYAMSMAEHRLVGEGHTEEAITWLEELAKIGNVDAAEAADRLREAPQVDEKLIEFYRGKVEESGEGVAEALAFYERVSTSGESQRLRQAADDMKWGGQVQEAYMLHDKAVKAGDVDALQIANERIIQIGRTVRHTREDGQDLLETAEALNCAGRTYESTSFYQRAAEAGNFGCLRTAARRMAAERRAEEALTWLHGLAEAGNRHAQELVANQREWQNWAERADRLVGWACGLADSGFADAFRVAASELVEVGRIEAALTTYMRGAEAADRRSLIAAADLLKRGGRFEEGERLSRFGIEPGGRIAEPW
ncbi:hypothetical protein ABZZ79_22010 [Streptomyces sp. NPDC006458]|uniref:tetratricopeptide repeat protein n=1 Tax=Streptomyces sp. NPDC006458 TaxID=3154302 RepID=UPI0033B43B2D